MLDNITIHDIDGINEAQWAHICRILTLAFGDDTSEPEAVEVGELPKALEEGLSYAVQDIRIEHGLEEEEPHLLYITMEQVSRDLDEVLHKALLAKDMTLLANQEDYTDAGHGESEALYACEGYGVHLHAWMPEYCDDDCDSTLTISLDLRPEKERREAEEKCVNSINDAIVRRVQQAMTKPAGQRMALATKLRELATRIEATTASDETCAA